jgi:DNA-binding protein HU-beta
VNKSELIDAVASAADISKTAAGRAIDSLTDAIGDALKNGDQVTLVGFGTFSVRDRAERKGRNPQTGEEITIKAAKIPSFKAGKGLKDTIK